MKQLKCECGSCTTCKSRERMRISRQENPEHVKAIDRNRYYRNWSKRRSLSDEYRRRNPDLMLKISREWKQRNPEKYKAQNIANNALRDGKLQKQPCEICGTWERVHKHHEDYSKPLEVTWLCATCHGKRHRRYTEGEQNVS